MKVAAILLIAGNSSRFKSSTPKQLFSLKGKPLFTYPLNVFVKNKNINDVIVVVNKNVKKEVEKFASNKVKIVLGGKTRHESVSNALAALNYENNDIVIIHDGARPLIDDKIIKDSIAGAKRFGAVSTAIKAQDTLAKFDKNNKIVGYANREEIVLVQTPQTFKFEIIKKAHKKASKCTDDTSIVKELGYQVHLIQGSKKLHKVTTIEDVKYIESLM